MLFLMACSLRIVERVSKDANDDAAAIFVAVITGSITLCQIRAVRQALERFQDHVAFDANQEFLAASVEFFPVVVAEKSAVFREQRVGRQSVPQLAGQGL